MFSCHLYAEEMELAIGIKDMHVHAHPHNSIQTNPPESIHGNVKSWKFAIDKVKDFITIRLLLLLYSLLYTMSGIDGPILTKEMWV